MSHSIVRRVRALVVLLATGCSSERHAASDIETVADPVVDGTLATACQWPTALSVNGCSATLVHPKLVTLAAHCLEGGSFPNEVRFGEDDSRPERRVPVETCKGYPDFVVGRTDVAYCTLTSEVRDVPPTPIIMGCETDFLQLGSNLTLVGFGLTAANAVETSGKKRWADVQLRRFVSTGPSIQVGVGTATSCSGDSGGPLYAKLSDGTFRAVGAASLTRLVDGECAPPAYYTLLHPFVGWMETNSGLDLTPCHDADGKWNPGPDCGRFATAADRSNGTWAEGCNAGATSGAGALCERSIDAGLDEAPPPSDATSGQDASAGDPSDAGSCTCRVGARDTRRTRDAWISMLALVWVARLRRRPRCRLTLSPLAFGLFFFLGLLARPATAAPSVDGWSASGSVLISPLYGEAQAADNHHLGGANVALGARLDGRYPIAGFLFALGTDYMQGAESHPSRHLAIPVRLAFFPIRTHAVEVGAGLGGGPAFSWYPGEPGVGGAALRAIGFMLELRIEGAIPLSDELSLLSSIGARGYSERFTNARPGTYAASGFALPAVAVDLGLGLAWKL